MATQQTFERKNLFKDFDIDFSNNPLTGDVGSKSDINAVNQSVKNLINTNYYERPFDPTFGCNIRGLLFELADPITIEDLRGSIKETLQNHEPRIDIIGIIIKDLPDQNAYHINIQYNIISKNIISEFNTILKRLR
tara:strand:+ start:841 stop:1248 length:408 start_codon:yes stop_codon:yes gene_type:complete